MPKLTNYLTPTQWALKQGFSRQYAHQLIKGKKINKKHLLLVGGRVMIKEDYELNSNQKNPRPSTRKWLCLS